MLFNSFSFALFLPIVFAIYWLIGSHRYRLQNLFVVTASYVFYGAWDWRFLLLIGFTTFCSWISGIAISSRRGGRYGKIIIAVNISINLAILGLFKYYNFFVSELASLLDLQGNTFLLQNCILPVGISFYTFQALSYSIDVYRGKVSPTHDIVAFFAYVSFFPQLVAGPIESATNLLPQFLRPRLFDQEFALDGCRRMLWGFFKKMVVADNCAVYVNMVWENYADQTGSTLLLAAILFSFQIYGDFSGYSDIAIGCAQLFGIRLRDNFITPFFSRDIAEFWRRWHISLNSWFVDYVYIPLGGSRVGTVKKIRNTFAIFILSGIWHGANWTYLYWGFYNALLFLPLLLTNTNKRYRDSCSPYSYTDYFRMLLTFSLVTLGLVCFRAPTITDAWRYVCGMCSSTLAAPLTLELEQMRNCLYAILVCIIIEWLQRKRQHALSFSGLNIPIWLRTCICYAVLLYIICDTGQSVTFIYFQF